VFATFLIYIIRRFNTRVKLKWRAEREMEDSRIHPCAQLEDAETHRWVGGSANYDVTALCSPNSVKIGLHWVQIGACPL